MLFCLGQVKPEQEKHRILSDFCASVFILAFPGKFSCKLCASMKKYCSCEENMLQKYILMMLGTAGIFLGFENPVRTIPFAVLFYPFSLYVLAHSSKNYVRETLIMGMLGYGSAFYWLAVTAHQYGDIPYALAVFIPLLLGFYFAVYGTLTAVYAHKVVYISPLYKICSLGLVWYFTELFRAWFLTGFPWFTLSSAFAPLPAMVQAASLFGSYVLSGLFAMGAFFLAELMVTTKTRKQTGKLRSFGRIGDYAGILLLTAMYFYGAVTLQKVSPMDYESTTNIVHKKLDVSYLAVHESPSMQDQALHKVLRWADKDVVNFSIIQGNISQNIKWSPLFQKDSLQKFFRLSEEAKYTINGESIFIYPETAFPITSFYNKELYQQILDFSADKTLLFGIPYLDHEKYYNSIELAQNGRSLAYYAKEHLVPFGEYVPAIPFLDSFNEILAKYGGAYSLGQNEQPILHVRYQDKEIHILPLICYEAIFPELSWKRLQKDFAHVLLNVSNDAWYDKSSAPYQHLNLARMRSIECGLPMIRASNTGISAFIDKYGQIIIQSALFTDESLTMPLPIRPYEPTIFVVIAPYLPYLGIALFLFLQMLGNLHTRLNILRRAAETHS